MAGGGAEPLDVSTVFNTITWTGNGVTSQFRSTGSFDLVNNDGFTLVVTRSSSTESVQVYERMGGVNRRAVISSESYAGFSTNNQPVYYNNGLSFAGTTNNQFGVTYVAYSFNVAPTFLSLSSYTGIGGSYIQNLPHTLGLRPGMVIQKNRTGFAHWNVYNKQATGTNYWFPLALNNPAASGFTAAMGVFATDTLFGGSSQNSNTITADANELGTEYSAYVLGHDEAPEGVIQHGEYTGTGTTSGPVITLGWEPQFILFKSVTGNAPFLTWDATTNGTNSLFGTTAENVWSLSMAVSSTGFQLTGNDGFNGVGGKYTYMAIRKAGV